MDSMDGRVSQSFTGSMSPGDSTSVLDLTSDTSSQCSDADPRCRKSSRLKAKKSRQAEEVLPPAHDNGDAYNLRLSSLVKRVQVERRQSTPKQSKGKSRPPPLSKYRRRTANARERQRMKEINEGFECLRKCLPDQELQGRKSEKLTKLTILSVAMDYIHTLRKTLDYPGEGDSRETGPGEDSELGSDAASAHTASVSSASCDDSSSSSSSPVPSAADLKPCSQPEEPWHPSLLSPAFTSCALPSPEHSTLVQPDPTGNTITASFISPVPSSTSFSPAPHLPAMVQAEVNRGCSLFPTCSIPSPSPRPLPLPEDCMDLDQADLLDMSLALAELDSIVSVL